MHITLKAAVGCALLISAGAMAQTTGSSDSSGSMSGPTGADHANPHPNAPGAAKGNTLGSPAVEQNRDNKAPADAAGKGPSD